MLGLPSALGTLTGRISISMATLPVKRIEKKGTGLCKGTVESVVLISDELNSLRLSRC